MSTKTILITGGRAPVTLDLVRQLHACGYRILVAESLPYHLCRTSNKVAKSFQVPSPKQQPQRFIDELISIIEQEAVDHLLPTCEEIFTIAAKLDQFPAFCQVWCEPLSRLKPLHNKWRFMELAKQHGWRIPQTWFLRSKEELMERLKQVDSHQKWIVKPVYSRFASQVIRLEHPHASFDHSCTISTQTPWLLQEWIEGQQICTYSFAVDGKTLAYAAYPTRFTAGGGACISFQPYSNKLLQQKVEQFIAAHRLTGQFAFDWIETEKKEWIPIECNPRATSGLHLLASTANWRIILGDDKRADSICFTPSPDARYMIGLAMWTYGLSSIRSLQDVKQWLNVFWTSKDVLFRIDDYGPFFEQFRMLLYLYTISRKFNISLTESSTYDIEWNGEVK